MKKKLAIIFGGQSAEHEISVLSARNVYSAVNKEKYEVVLIGITKQGKWFYQNTDALGGDQTGGIVSEVTDGKGPVVFDMQQAPLFDVAFPVLHGPFGEDGSIQGLMKMLHIPCVGPGVLSSAVGMDKDITKKLLSQAGMKVARWITVYKNDHPLSFTEVQKVLGPIVFVKPANMGSSVGVSRVSSETEYQKAIHEAFIHDDKVLIEEQITGREIECSVLGNTDIQTSGIGEIVPAKNHTFYSYAAKYTDANGADLIIPAGISHEKREEAKALACKTFQTLGCRGMARVDMFFTQDEQIYVNEVNTIPGFTNMSMYPKLWEHAGKSQEELVEKLIQLALQSPVIS